MSGALSATTCSRASEVKQRNDPMLVLFPEHEQCDEQNQN